MSQGLNQVRLLDTCLTYEDCGRGEAILMLHGYPQDHRAWRHQSEHFARAGYRVLVPDLPGWGTSTFDETTRWTYEREVDRLDELLRALGLSEPLNVFGHDYGGFLALGLAVRHPERVRRLAILNSRAHRTFPGLRYAVTALPCAIARRAALRWVLRLMPVATVHHWGLRSYVARGCFSDSLAADYVRCMRGPEGKRFFSRFFADYSLPPRPELADGLRHIAYPSAVVWGDRDAWAPWSVAESLARLLPSAAITRITGGGHFVMEERPADVTRALAALLVR